MSESEIPDADVVSVPMLDLPMLKDIETEVAEYPAWGEPTRSPQCFAYSQAGLRCEMHAGHMGLHSVASTWGDDECYVPGTTYLTGTLGPAIPAFATDGGASLPDVAANVEPCVVCNHGQQSHGPDGCVRRNSEGDDCGCREFV